MPIRRPQTWKPPQGTPLASNPLTRGLVMAFAFNEGAGNPRDGVAGAIGTIGGTGLIPRWAAWAGGLGLNFVAANAEYVLLSGLPPMPTAAITVMAMAAIPSTANFGMLFSSTTATELRQNGTTGKIDWLCAGQTVTSASSYAGGVPHVFAGSYDGHTVALWVDGGQVATASSSSPVTYGANNTIGARDIGSFSWQGPIGGVVFWDRSLSAAEHAAIGASPNAIWPLVYDERPYYRLLRGASASGVGRISYYHRRRRTS